MNKPNRIVSGGREVPRSKAKRCSACGRLLWRLVAWKYGPQAGVKDKLGLEISHRLVNGRPECYMTEACARRRLSPLTPKLLKAKL